MSNFKVPFLDLKSSLSEKNELLASIGNVLDHGQLVMGPEIKELEEKVASFCDRKFCTAVGSGTTALVLALKALELQHSNEVITLHCLGLRQPTQLLLIMLLLCLLM